MCSLFYHIKAKQCSTSAGFARFRETYFLRLLVHTSKYIKFVYPYLSISITTSKIRPTTITPKNENRTLNKCLLSIYLLYHIFINDKSLPSSIPGIGGNKKRRPRKKASSAHYGNSTLIKRQKIQKNNYVSLSS
jgi:hypothetical protein